MRTIGAVSLRALLTVSYTHLDVYKRQDQMSTIAHLTKAIALKEDYTEALLLRAEELLSMQVYKDCLLYTSRCV